MTAPSELFVKDLRDKIEDSIAKLFGTKDFEIEVPDEWRDKWDPSVYPDSGKAKIFTSGVAIAEVSWKVKFSIVEGISGRYIEAEVGDYEIRPLKSIAFLEALADKQASEKKKEE